MINHSLHYPGFLRYPFFLLFVASFWVALTAPVQAQMFSVDENPDPNASPYSEIYLGFEPTLVTYEGPENPDDSRNLSTGQFEYDAPVLRVGYSGQAVNVFIGAGGKITGSDDVAYFDLGGNINYEIPLYKSSPFKLIVPVRISSRYTNITTDEIADTFDRVFRYGSLIAGAGIKTSATFTSDVRLQVGAIPSYGFTFASGGFFGGGLGTIEANGRLFFDRLFGKSGLSVGYKYDFRAYNIDEDKFDYHMRGHSIQMGITF